MCDCPRHHDDLADCTCICPEHENFHAAYDLAMSRFDLLKACVEEGQAVELIVRSAINLLMLSDNFGDVHEAVDVLRGAVDLDPLEGNYLDGWDDADWVGLTEDAS